MSDERTRRLDELRGRARRCDEYGVLHVVVEDENVEDHHLESCLLEARAAGQDLEAGVAEDMLRLTRNERLYVVGDRQYGVSRDRHLLGPGGCARHDHGGWAGPCSGARHALLLAGGPDGPRRPAAARAAYAFQWCSVEPSGLRCACCGELLADRARTLELQDDLGQTTLD